MGDRVTKTDRGGNSASRVLRKGGNGEKYTAETAEKGQRHFRPVRANPIARRARSGSVQQAVRATAPDHWIVQMWQFV